MSILIIISIFVVWFMAARFIYFDVKSEYDNDFNLGLALLSFVLVPLIALLFLVIIGGTIQLYYNLEGIQL